MSAKVSLRTIPWKRLAARASCGFPSCKSCCASFVSGDSNTTSPRTSPPCPRRYTKPLHGTSIGTSTGTNNNFRAYSAVNSLREIQLRLRAAEPYRAWLASRLVGQEDWVLRLKIAGQGESEKSCACPGVDRGPASQWAKFWWKFCERPSKVRAAACARSADTTANIPGHLEEAAGKRVAGFRE